ncbi:MFS transporter [Cryptosporangium aurantiacum]|uniref:Predicted arabinose efflux permease, MFS family n=1 Tax=Cryptosporangium aurantiacum TaxID=134849 RepID=A0A1M7QSC2_9ACTN|nr:MFS transporter [Cryptosporangium aurantiacum]SHN34604.1 Predicted arabinose efflux permease, MFS family [Cryptosporangium aurantiacum]
MYPSDALGVPLGYRPARANARPTAGPRAEQQVGAAVRRPTGRGLPAAGLMLSTATWYTMFLFAAGAPAILGPLFFTRFGGATGNVFALATAGVAFLARPIGALVFGRLGDTVGRRAALLSSLALAGTSIVLIGALPTEENIGTLAPALLVSLQLLHGFAIGGIWSGMALSLTEAAPPRRRGLIGGFVQGGVSCGAILANIAIYAANSAFDDEMFASFGWRIPFLAGGVLLVAVVAIAVRPRDPDQQVEQIGRPHPIRSTLRRPGRLLMAAGLLFSANAAFYVTITGTVEYGVTELKLARADLVGGAFIAAVVGVLGALGGGALADRMGRRPVVMLGAVASGLWAFPFFWLVNTAAVELITFSMAVSGLASALGYGAVAAYLTELFDRRSRYTGTALAYHLGAAVAGGAAQVAVLKLPTYVESGVPWFLIGASVLTVLCALALPETKPRSAEQLRYARLKQGSGLG